MTEDIQEEYEIFESKLENYIDLSSDMATDWTNLKVLRAVRMEVLLAEGSADRMSRIAIAEGNTELAKTMKKYKAMLEVVELKLMQRAEIIRDVSGEMKEMDKKANKLVEEVIELSKQIG